MSLPVIYSMIFYLACIGYTFLGLFVLIKDKCFERKITFLGVCFTLGLWSFSFAIANSADNLATALLWRRIAVFGWGIMYSFLLHFILVLTDRYQRFRKSPFVVLIYLPAVIIVFCFALYEPTALNQSNLVLTPSGWVNESNHNGLDQAFNIYYILYSCISLLLLLQTGLKQHGEKRMAMLLIFSTFLLALVLGSLTDVVMNTFHHVVTPQMAPAIILLPVSAILFSIQHYHLIMIDKSPVIAREGEILNIHTHRKVFRYLAVSYLIGANTCFISSYFILHIPFIEAFWPSLLLTAVSLTLNLINDSSLIDSDKDLILITILSLTIPFLLFHYQEFAAITIWAIPVVFIILLIPFRNEKYLIILGTSYLVSLFSLWVEVPVLAVDIGSADHLNRMLFIFLFLAMAVFVNRTFLRRLRDNEEQIHLQKLLSEVSADLINISAENQDEKILNLLKRLSLFLRCDRICLVFFGEDESAHKNYQWQWDDCVCAEPVWLKKVIFEKKVFILDVMKAEPEIKSALPKEICAFFAVPVISNHGQGALQVGYLESRPIWGDNQISGMEICSNLLIDALNNLQSEERIKKLAYFDGLTGLPNRTLYFEHLEREIGNASRNCLALAVLFLDIDDFKAVNDTLGHDAGDELLIEVGNRLEKKVRQNDVVSRFGGDEFLILLNGIKNLTDLHYILDKIITVFKKPIQVRDQELFISASAGVSLYPDDGEDPDSLIKNADLAMYHSKDLGKNRVTFCSANLKEDLKYKTRLTNDLYRAVEKNELELYYQPQVSLATMEINGIEALIRWNHPEMGLLTPGAFIPLAQKHPGLMKPIDQWVIEESCSQIKNWSDQGFTQLPVAVNISSEQLENPDLVEIVKANLGKNKLRPERLELEIAETLAFQNDQKTLSNLKALKELGVSIAIDDFGVEYSSLNRIKTMPFDRIKMDITFIREIDENPKNRPIAKTIIQLAKILDLRVLAEGVETETQLDFLKESDCDEVQGFYFYRPMKAKEITQLIRKKNK
ncbi:EAL domain-containing protein [Eubacteriaceae bacterium ES2]|nr:EAL domain-containing protein [Eubacteriaceae bacterium ES2]